MSVEVVTTTKSLSHVSDIIDSLGEVLSGDKPDRHGLREVFWSAFAFSLATSVHRAFLIKSKHGTDELGEKWDDLDPKTKAYSRKDGREGLTLHKGKPTPYGNTHRPTLTKDQDKAWRKQFVSALSWLRTQMSESEAASQAASIAWKYVKDVMGATTILEYAKNRTLLLLQRSGRLERSLRPGKVTGDTYTPPLDQVYRISKEGLTWGSKVEYANRVGKKRPLWPKDIDPWITAAIHSGINAVVKKLKEIVV